MWNPLTPMQQPQPASFALRNPRRQLNGFYPTPWNRGQQQQSPMQNGPMQTPIGAADALRSGGLPQMPPMQGQPPGRRIAVGAPPPPIWGGPLGNFDNGRSRALGVGRFEDGQIRWYQ